jgi:hypothetical protein
MPDGGDNLEVATGLTPDDEGRSFMFMIARSFDRLLQLISSWPPRIYVSVTRTPAKGRECARQGMAHLLDLTRRDFRRQQAEYRGYGAC